MEGSRYVCEIYPWSSSIADMSPGLVRFEFHVNVRDLWVKVEDDISPPQFSYGIPREQYFSMLKDDISSVTISNILRHMDVHLASPNFMVRKIQDCALAMEEAASNGCNLFSMVVNICATHILVDVEEEEDEVESERNLEEEESESNMEEITMEGAEVEEEGDSNLESRAEAAEEDRKKNSTVLYEEIDVDDSMKEEFPLCMICLEEFSIGSKGVYTECDHLYHHECLKQWMLIKITEDMVDPSCPICRATLSW